MLRAQPNTTNKKEYLQSEFMLLLQGTREEGYTDPAMAAQDAMVNRTSPGVTVGLDEVAQNCGATWQLCGIPGAVGGLPAEDRRA